MAKKKQEKPDHDGLEMKETELEEAGSIFGLASRPFRIELKPGQDELTEVEIPLDRELCASREVNPATIRVYRWDEEAERFHLVEASGIDERWESARARVFEPGVYVAAGASSNPWVGNAVSILRTFGPLLHHPELGPIIRDRLCPVILCPSMLGEVFEAIGDPRQHGLPAPPPRDLCELCLGGGIGHGADVYPEPRRPPPGGDSCGLCDLHAYLRCNPRIARRIVWRGSTARRYPSWSSDQKTDLATAFDTIRAGGEVGLPETAPATAFSPGALLTRLSEADAWEAYVAHLAQTLVVESCEWVDWRIGGYSDDELRLLLDSDAMFTRTSDGEYAMMTWPHGVASHGDPTRVYEWLRSAGLIASDHLTTVGRVLEWCRDNLSHYLYGPSPENMELHWGYRGFPPVERIIAGTDSPWGHRHWTAGCWGTSGFLRLVLRTINLPATFVTNCGHAQPWFPTIERYLSHGDDPYNRNTRDAGAAGTDLLLDPETFDSWFDPDVPGRCDNIGRRPRELAEEE